MVSNDGPVLAEGVAGSCSATVSGKELEELGLRCPVSGLDQSMPSETGAES